MNHTISAHRRRAAALTATAALVIGACSGGDETAATTTDAATTTAATSTTTTTTSTPTTSTTTSTSASTTTTTLPVIARQPLTGEPLGKGDAPIDRPALAVKIDNAPQARANHSGLAAADIVFEEIVEGGITRFAAVFHSQGSDPVGPIRSGRSQDVDLLTPLREPLFAWSGGNRGVQALVSASSLVDLGPRRADAYYRGAGSAPHDLYSDTETLWALTPADHPGAPPQQFEYLRPGDTIDGDPTGGLELALRSMDIEWTWDPSGQQFLRSQQGDEHVDAVHGRIGATNVVVLGVAYQRSQVDAQSPEAQTIGEGPVWVFTDGTVRSGRWVRVTATQPFSLVDEAGSPIVLAPGNTWVELAEGGDPDLRILPAP